MLLLALYYLEKAIKEMQHEDVKKPEPIKSKDFLI